MACRRSTLRQHLTCSVAGAWDRTCTTCMWEGCNTYKSRPSRTRIDDVSRLEEYTVVENARDDDPNPGRTGLYYSKCQYTYRPKFICPKPSCRRMLKPFYDPDRFDYKINEYCDWIVNPKADTEAQSSRVAKRWIEEALAKEGRPKKWADKLSPEEKRRFRQEINDGDFEIYISKPLDAKRNGRLHWKRCPRCAGDVVMVGSTFRIPARRDEKGWRWVEKLIAEGTDMVARFSCCATFERHEKMVEELQMVQWVEEEQRWWDGFVRSDMGV